MNQVLVSSIKKVKKKPLVSIKKQWDALTKPTISWRYFKSACEQEKYKKKMEKIGGEAHVVLRAQNFEYYLK